ncbi:MAG: cytochrome O ubiquinol oxidase [Acidiferrobacter sp.]
MTHATQNAFEHPEVQLANGGYVVAYIVAMALMAVSLVLVRDHMLSPVALAVAISASAAVVGIVQCVLLLHMNLSDTQIWHTIALVLFIPLFVLAIGLTSWMFHGLYQRTMIMSVTHGPKTSMVAPAVKH